MKVVEIIVILFLIDGGGLTRISAINDYKEKAQKAYESSDYQGAVKAYRFLIDSMGVTEDPLYLNLANAYFHLSDTSNAAYFYVKTIDGKNEKLASKAYSQLGVISKWKNDNNTALNRFKLALKSDPSNETARYNYELLKKLMERKKQQQKNDKNKKQEPSEYAKKLKKQADALVHVNRFEEAFSIMKKGLEVDKTVSAYNDYIKRLQDVVESRQ
jgi:tetratricopeptide (TPR) repeat protein